MKRLSKFFLSILGTIFIGLAIIGIFLPLLPTTPFLLLSAACYIRGSKRLYDWLINHKIFGKYILNYQQGNGIPLGTKVISISLLWLTIGYSILFVINNLYVKLLLMAIAIGVTIHLLYIKTLK